MKLHLVVLFALLCRCALSYGSRSGICSTSDISTALSSMPGRLLKSGINSDFRIYFSGGKYTPGAVNFIWLNRTTGNTGFRGLLLYVENSQGTRLGILSGPSTAQNLNLCGGFTTLTHQSSSSGDNTFQPRQAFTWIAPGSLSGPIVVRAIAYERSRRIFNVPLPLTVHQSTSTSPPTDVPTLAPTTIPTTVPTLEPTDAPTDAPTAHPTSAPSTISTTTNPPLTTKTCVPRRLQWPIKDMSLLPRTNISVSINPQTLTLTVEIHVEFVSSPTTYVIDLTGYLGEISNPTNCENRNATSFAGVSWQNIWNPSQPNAIGSVNNLLYPPTTGTKWTVDHPTCRVVRYRAQLSWRDIASCRTKNGRLSAHLTDTAQHITLSGNIEVSAVAPFSVSANLNFPFNTFKYYNLELVRQKFQMKLFKLSAVTKNVNLAFSRASILQAKLNHKTNKVEILFLTMIHSFARFVSGNLISAPGSVTPLVSLSITRAFGNGDGCINSGASTCLQGWKMEFNLLACPKDYSGKYRFSFNVDCRTSLSSIQRTICLGLKQRFGVSGNGVFPIDVDLNHVILKDTVCNTVNVSQYIPFTVTHASPPSQRRIYNYGEPIRCRLQPAANAINLTEFTNLQINGFDLLNVWMCFAPNLTSIPPVNQQTNLGGCFSSVVGTPNLVRTANGFTAPGWNFTIISRTPYLEIEFSVSSGAVNVSSFVLHMQVGIDMSVRSSARRLLVANNVEPSRYSYVVSEFTVSDGSGTTIKPEAGKQKTGESEVSVGGWIGIGIGVAVGCCLGGLLVYFFWTKRNHVMEDEARAVLELEPNASSNRVGSASPGSREYINIG